ncbi:MAG: hypothetical protein ACHP91_11230 [Burkholderiales bacterium]|jgi:O-antigen ligase
MDNMHSEVWALWRLLIVALIMVPFIVAAVIARIRDSRAADSMADVESDDRKSSLPSARPATWRTEGADVRMPTNDAAQADARHAA